MQDIYLNSPFSLQENCLVPALSPSLVDGTPFSTILVQEGKLVFWEEHRKRLEHSMQVFWQSSALDIQRRLEELEKLMARHLSILDFHALRIRLSAEQSLEVLVRELNPALKKNRRESLKVMPQKGTRLIGGEVKWAHYSQILEDQKLASQEGFDDILYVDGQGNILEAGFSNFILFSADGVLKSPEKHPQIFEGIMMKKIFEVALDLGLEVKRGALGLEEIKDARWCALTNCLRGVRLADFGQEGYDEGAQGTEVLTKIRERINEKIKSEMPSL